MTLGYGPDWLRQRSTGLFKQNNSPMSANFVKNLNQELILEGHTGCVNCLEWNQRGTLLASGSDDRNVIVWNPFSNERKIVKTGHRNNIFSVKFIQNFSDSLVATCAGDGQILLTDIHSSRSLMNCRGCHMNRLKRLATHPSQPCLIWSAGEDGCIMQHDIREKHLCNQSGANSNLIIDLRQESLSVKCLAINPLRDEMLAVGTDDVQVRLYDRRRPTRPTRTFLPGHLTSQNTKTFGTTYLAFNRNGSELLANLHAEQVYLFDTNEPQESLKSFEVTIKPLLLDYSQPRKRLHKTERVRVNNSNNNAVDPLKDLVDDMKLTYSGGHLSLREYIEKLNSIISEFSGSPSAYSARAAAMMQRDWRGDNWQALRDCCDALALKPLNYEVIGNLAQVSYNLKHQDLAQVALAFIELILKEFNDAKQLEPLARKLTSFLKHEIGSLNHVGNKAVRRPGLLNYNCDNLGITTNAIMAKNNNNNNSRSQHLSKEFDFTKRYCGHCNMNTDIKEANYLGPNDEFIVAGSDDGAVYIWDKNTTNIVKAMYADAHILNCIQPHPTICMLATSGVEPNVKIWSTSGKTCRDIKTLDARCSQNQDFMSVDPLEAMIMMLYPD